MKNILLKTTAIASLAILPFVSGGLNAQAAEGLSKNEVESIIADYVKGNPEIIIEALENYRVQQEQDEKASAQEKISKYQNYFQSDDMPSVGNKDADVTVVEFFDYNCGYCRRAVPDIQELVAQDDSVRFVFKEMPILSANSNDIAKWALAANKQGKYFEFHAALMNHKGTRNASTMKKIAKDVGLDPEQLEKDANSSTVKAELDKSISVARDIGISGTPAFIINGELYPGYLGPEGLKRAVQAARANL